LFTGTQEVHAPIERRDGIQLQGHRRRIPHVLPFSFPGINQSVPKIPASELPLPSEQDGSAGPPALSIHFRLTNRHPAACRALPSHRASQSRGFFIIQPS